MNSWDELLKAFESGLISDPKVDYEHRLFYDLNGEIVGITHLKSDNLLQFPYIVVEEIPENIHRWKIKDKILVQKPKSWDGTRCQIVKSDKGFSTVKNHPALVLYSNENYFDLEFYDYRRI